MRTLLMLLAATTAYAGSWFVEPTAGLVFPDNSKLVYHGMNGSVAYKDGYSVGLNAGRYVGPFKLYLSYDYTQFRAKSETLNTPYGQQTQADNDLFQSHTVLFNARYEKTIQRGFKAFFGTGMGCSFNGTESFVSEVSAGINRRVGFFDVSIAYSYRWTDGQEKWGKKSNGSYSIVLDEPDQQRLTLSAGWRF